MNKLKKSIFCLAAASVLLLAVFVIGGAMRRDTTAPVITCPERVLKAKASITQEELLKGVTASDDRDGDLTGDVVVESLSAIGKNNTREITYAVMDLSGNVGRATRKLRYTNYTPPRIQLDQPLRVDGLQGIMERMESIRATSRLDGDLTAKVKYSFPDGGYINKEGEHEVLVQVSDSAGVSITIPTILDIYNSQEETIEIDLKKYIDYVKVGDKFDPYDYYEIASQPGRLIVDSNVDTSVPGVYHVRYTVEDTHSGEYGKTILIVVVEE